MKRLILPLIAVLALPTAVNAETWWLLMRGINNGAGIIAWQIPTQSQQQCNEEKSKALNRENWASNSKMRRLVLDAICLKGK